MNFLMYCRITDTTGKKLANELGIPHGYYTDIPNTRLDTLIRWGNSSGITLRPRQTINPKDAMNKAINKSLATQVMRQARVKVPESAEVRGRVVVPCVGRAAYHTQGESFWLCWDESQVEGARQEGAEYFIKYVAVKQEYRVHVIDGEAKFVQAKFARDRISTAYMGVQGFTDTWPTTVLSPRSAASGVCAEAVKAVSAIGLDFGGVDVIKAIDDSVVVLEVNTGPALMTEECRAPYLEYFRARMES